MNFSTTCLPGCTPPQIININFAINDISSIAIYDDCDNMYSFEQLKYAYSLDSLCWSCYMTYTEILTNTLDIKQDFYIRIEITGIVGKILVGGEQTVNYSTELKGCFTFNAGNQEATYNPYSNMDNAISLSQQLAESVSQLVGIPIYYIKLKPNADSKDLTFKEYTLMNVDSIKQIKLIIQDNEMPSSKPEFNEWGLDWQTDWEVEITKGSFATAFGNTAQPMEGDLIYIPMMKRMWMVNAAYEEKKDGFMWIATTFKLALVKYQEKDSVELGDTEEFVNSIVKNKYEDLFGEDEQTTRDSGETSIDVPIYTPDRLYPVYRSDATRKYVTCDSVDVMQNNIYVRGALISDTMYKNPYPSSESTIIYQKKYCGDSLSLSFILNFEMIEQKEGTIIEIGHVRINYRQVYDKVQIYLMNDEDITLDIHSGETYFIIFKWDKRMNLIDATAYQYDHIKSVPLYKLTPAHYFFNIDEPVSTKTSKYNIELSLTEPSDVKLHGIYGWITNFKLFDLYNDDISELLQMYPTNQHLAINDTARRILLQDGVQT